MSEKRPTECESNGVTYPETGALQRTSQAYIWGALEAHIGSFAGYSYSTCHDVPYKIFRCSGPRSYPLTTNQTCWPPNPVYAYVLSTPTRHTMPTQHTQNPLVKQNVIKTRCSEVASPEAMQLPPPLSRVPCVLLCAGGVCRRPLLPRPRGLQGIWDMGI